MPWFWLKVAAFSGADALAVANGARTVAVELNAPGSCAVGGLTPPVAELRALRDMPFPTAVHVVVRPRAGDFVYDAPDVAAMVLAVCRFKAAGVLDVLRRDAFVFAALRPDGDVDAAVCEALVAAARPFACVFHRAFDAFAAHQGSPAAAAARLARLGFDAVLSAGGTGPGGCAAEPHLAELERLYPDTSLRVFVDGVRSHNVAAVAARLNRLRRQESVFLHTAPVRLGSPGPDGREDHVLDRDELTATVDVILDFPEPA